MKKELLDLINAIIKNWHHKETEQGKLVLKKYKHVRYVLTQSIFELIPTQKLTNIKSHLTNANNQMQNIGSLASYADAMISEIPLPINARRKKQESEAELEELQSKSLSIIEALRSEKEELVAELQSIRSDSESLNPKLKSLEDRIDKEASRLDTMVSGEAESFGEKKRNLEETVQQELSEIKLDIEKLRESSSRDLESIIESAQDKYDSIDELHELFSKTSVSKFYATRVQAERNAATWKSILAMIFYMLVPFSAIYLFLHDENVSLDLLSISKKILVGLTFIIPAVYFSKESSKHRQQQFDMQKTGLRSQAFEPFIKHLGDDEQKTLRAEMVQEWFKDKEKDTASKEPIVGYSLNKITKLIEAVSGLVSKP